MRVCFLILALLSSLMAQSQSFFKLSGEITDPAENHITFTIYKNWFEDPQKYQLRLASDNSWMIEMPLDEIGYCDISFGEYSISMMKVEPGDNIKITFDQIDFYNSLKIEGEGSEKWKLGILFQNLYNKVDLELNTAINQPKENYYRLFNQYFSELSDILENNRSQLSSDFYELEKLDISGKFKLKELGYYNIHNISVDSLQTDQEPASVWEYKSFYMNQLQEQLILYTLENLSDRREFGFNSEDLYSLEGKYNRIIIEKVLSERILEFIEFGGDDEKAEIMAFNFMNYSRNELLKDRINRRLNKRNALIKGRMAPDFILKNNKGKYITLSDFRGKNVVLGFYYNDCLLCLDDLKAFQITENYFNKQGISDIAFVMVNLSPFKEFKSFYKQTKPVGIHLNGYEDKFLNDNYKLDILPEYFLIDSSGSIVTSNLGDPSADSGRALIRLLNETFYKK